MAQDTRKDPRAKIVSLNVRYKSATVDEFIENHSHDVSKGGIFIKTSTPFAQGTLLKFEIRLSGDQAVIAGVGRVVWKRESGPGGGAEHPSGMGVKFIKIDESSRTVIDRLVDSRADAGSAFTSELPKEEIGKQTLLGTGTPHSLPPNMSFPPEGTAQSLPPRSVPPRPAGSLPPRKGTIMGMGAVRPESMPPQASPSTPSPATEGKSTLLGGFFPETNSEGDMPAPQERTMMKQAAALLEEALKEAGGSMEEVGTNPLFSGAAGKEVAEPKPPSAPSVSPSGNTLEETPGSSKRPTQAVSTSAPASATNGDRKAPWSERPPPGSVRPGGPVTSARAAVEGEPAKKGMGGALLVAAVFILVGGGLVYAYREGMLGGGETPVTTATAEPSAAPSPSSATEADAGGAPAAETESGSAAAATADAGSVKPSTSATVAVTATAKPPVVHTAPTPRPTATAHPIAAPTATAAEAPPATATAEPAAAPTATAAPATAAPAASEAPKPKTTPKPKASGDTTDDSPY